MHASRPAPLAPRARRPHAALVALLFATGCSLAHERAGAGGHDAGPPPPSDSGLLGDFGQTESYVLSAFRISSPDASGTTAFGLDLDGQVAGPAGTCTAQPDFRSPVSGALGVDNQLQQLFAAVDSMGEDAELGALIRGGELLVGVQVSDINSFADDSGVDVHLALLRPADGTMLPLGPNGELVAGGRFAVREDLGVYRGAITAGVLEVRTTASARVLPVLVSSPVLTVSSLALRARITASGLTSGELGGEVSPDELVLALSSLGATVDRESLDAIVPFDLHPDPSGIACTALSMGASIEGVTAIITGL
ncbi:MAG: hypothetical protein U0234_25910 [Sandaracinus sp.]